MQYCEIHVLTLGCSDISFSRQIPGILILGLRGQCSSDFLKVERSDIGVETGMQNFVLSPTSDISTMYVSFFWSQIAQKMRQQLTLVPCGTSFLGM